MNKIIIALLFFVISALPAAAAPRNEQPVRFSHKQIDSQLKKMRSTLPFQMQKDIQFVDIRRHGKEIKYTYNVDIDTASMDDDQRTAVIAKLEDFNCRQPIPVLCEGTGIIFASDLIASMSYYDSDGNLLFSCKLTPAICAAAIAANP